MERTPPIGVGKGTFFSHTFYTLRYRDFRLFWAALSISLLGVSFQTVAQGWLVYRLTGSATMLGIAGFVPVIFAGPASIIGGLMADQVSRRRLVIVTQSLMMAPPIVLAFLIWGELVQAWHVIAATSVLAIIAAIDLPSRTAMVPELVPPDDLLNAQGLASAVGQLTRILGPAIAGVIIGLWGEALPYFVNGLTYLAMVIALAMMSPQPPTPRDRTPGLPSGLLGGVKYISETPIVLGLFSIAAGQGVFLTSYITLLPVFASDILDVGVEGLGLLNAAIGIGALVGALGIANLGKGRRGQVLNIGSLIMPIALIGFAWSGKLFQSLPLLLILGLGTVVIRTITATYLLTVVPDQLRGRVISLATLIYFGAPYVGGLPIGYLAEQWRVPLVLSLTALLFLLIMIAVNLKIPAIRQQE